MSNELKSCPFCGGKAHFVEGGFPRLGTRYQVWHMCEDLPSGIAHNEIGRAYPLFTTPWYEDEETAIEAWNTRSERTCKNVSEDAERCNFFECSECGCLVEDGEHYEVYVGTDHGVELPWNYCPHCGRRVVS